MSRHVRFIVHQRLQGRARQVGLFVAAYQLRAEGEISRHHYEQVDRLLKWFESELPTPPKNTIPDQAIFWYRELGPYSRPMWRLANVLSELNLMTEKITKDFVGRLVYQDT